tara:strand:+ start:10220 stop:10594 length:375 start_codon:yes stop_codon:yes gene_type:complete
MRYFVLLLLLVTSESYTHEFTPTYPKLAPSYITGVVVAKMDLLNKRKDIEYYELSVLDSNMTPVTFASSDEIVRLKYLEAKKVEIYIRNRDLKKARFICSTSKILDIPGLEPSVVSSKICSRIK